jgi:hypothetical protein
MSTVDCKETEHLCRRRHKEVAKIVHCAEPRLEEGRQNPVPAALSLCQVVLVIAKSLLDVGPQEHIFPP